MVLELVEVARIVELVFVELIVFYGNVEFHRDEFAIAWLTEMSMVVLVETMVWDWADYELIELQMLFELHLFEVHCMLKSQQSPSFLYVFKY